MIRINLLTGTYRSTVIHPTGSADAAFESLGDEEIIRKQALLKLIVILIPVIAMFLYERQNLPSLTTKRNQLNQQVRDLRLYNAKAEASVREIKKFKEDEIRIQQRIDALEKMSKNRAVEVKLLKLLADVIPEKAWMTRVDVKDGRAVLSGLAFGNGDVNIFAERLKSNILIADLQLVRINEEKFDTRVLTRFEFSCLLEGKQ